MPLVYTADRAYLFAIDDANDRMQSVVYDTHMNVLWDRHSHEAKLPPNTGPYGHDPDGPGAPVVTEPIEPTVGRVIQVTDASDGEFVNRGYSYWSQAVVIGDAVIAFAGHVDGHPRFFSVSLRNGVVQRNLGALLRYTGTAEGWHFDREGWIYLCDGPRLRRVNPFSGEDRIVFDIGDAYPGHQLWQAHSSDDGQTHSATIQQVVSEGAYPKIATVVHRQGREHYFPALGPLDESAITSDGAFLIIKEGDDNRIVNLETGTRRIVTNAAGAIGHSDCGPGYVVGEDDQRGACIYWDLRTNERRVLYETWGMGHVSVRAGRCLLSDAMNLSLVSLTGAGLLTLAQHGMVGDDYDHQVFASLSPCGRVAAYMSNATGRMDLYLLTL